MSTQPYDFWSLLKQIKPTQPQEDEPVNSTNSIQYPPVGIPTKGDVSPQGMIVPSTPNGGHPSGPNHPIWDAILKSLGAGLATTTPERGKIWDEMQQNQRQTQQLQAQTDRNKQEDAWKQFVFSHQNANELAQSQTQNDQNAQMEADRQERINNSKRTQQFEFDKANQQAGLTASGMVQAGGSVIPNLLGASQVGDGPPIPAQPLSVPGGAVRLGGFGGADPTYINPVGPSMISLKDHPVLQSYFPGKDEVNREQVPDSIWKDSIDQEGKQKLLQQEQEQLGGHKAILKASIQTSLNPKSPQDVINSGLFMHAVEAAKNPQELDKVNDQFRDYINKDSHAAQQTKLQQELTLRQNEANIQKQQKLQDYRDQAPRSYQYMMEMGQSPDIALRGMGDGSAESRREIIGTWMDANKQAKDKGLPEPYPMPEFLTQHAQKSLEEIGATSDIVKDFQGALHRTINPNTGKPLDQDTTPWKQLPTRLQYATGYGAKDAELLNKMLVMDKIVAGRLSKGTGTSSDRIIKDLEVHTPQPQDSGSFMASKVGNIQNYINYQAQQVHKYGNKWGRVAATGDVNDTPNSQGDPQLKAILDKLVKK